MTVPKLLPWLALALMWALAAWTWPHAPEAMPVHWDAAGTPDRMGGRLEGVLLLPVVTTVAMGAFLLAPRLDPGGRNFAQMQGVWTAFQLSFVLLMGVVYGASLQLWPMGRVLPPTMGAFFLVLGATMGKIRPNYTFGVRTPWTLASKLAWTRTHRAGGFVFVGTGLAIIAAGAWSPAAAFAAMLLGALGGSAALAAYSWWVWRHDAERVPVGSTRPE